MMGSGTGISKNTSDNQNEENGEIIVARSKENDIFVSRKMPKKNKGKTVI